MALLKNKELPNGATVSYWRIGGFTYLKNNQKSIKSTVEGYLSKDAKEAGKTPLIVGQFTLEGEVNPELSITQQIYSALKKEELFSDAVDDCEGPFCDTGLVVAKEVKDKLGKPKSKLK